MELRRRRGIVLVGSCCAWCLGTAAVSAETPTKVTIKPLEDRVAVQEHD